MRVRVRVRARVRVRVKVRVRATGTYKIMIGLRSLTIAGEALSAVKSLKSAKII